MRAAARVWLPVDSPELVDGALDGLWPEQFYSELEALAPNEAFFPLLVLGNSVSRPALAHQIIVASAGIRSLPIVTTNFDWMLESAARELGVRYKVLGPHDEYSAAIDGVAIWKIHGSLDATNPSLLLATAPKLSRPNFPFIDSLSKLCAGRSVCIVGYSGTDLDIYPFLASALEKAVGVFWVDPAPSSAVVARARSLNAVLIERTLEDCLKDSPLVYELRKRPDSTVDELSRETLREHIARALSDLAIEASSHTSLSMPGKKLLLAVLLERRQKAALGLQYLEGFTSADLEGLSHSQSAMRTLLMARLADRVSDYDKSRSYAEVASRKLGNPADESGSSSHQITALRNAATNHRDMALLACLGPSLSYPSIGIVSRPTGREGVAIMSRYLFSAARMHFRLSRLRPSEDPVAKYWHYWALHWYYDHKIIWLEMVRRIGVMLEGRRLLPLRLLGGLIVSRVEHALHAIEQAAWKAGNAVILGHAQKQLQRLGAIRVASMSEGVQAYGLATDILNLALVHRNAGDTFLSEGDLIEASHAFRLALDYAAGCDSKSTMLKALIGLSASGQSIPLSALDEIAEGLTGYGYRRLVDQFRTYLMRE